MDEIIINGVKYHHIPVEEPGFCGSCDLLVANGDVCPKATAPCTDDTILRATTDKADDE
jgi:hypothetical protein